MNDFHDYFLEGRCKLCHVALGSSVERRWANAYDIPCGTGQRAFDLVVLGEVLLHTTHPPAATPPPCRGTVVIVQHGSGARGSRPDVLYVGGDEIGDANATWWYRNLKSCEQLLRKLGSRTVGIGVALPVARYYNRSVLHSRR